MVKALFGDIGSAGGHQAMAKAVVPLKAFRKKYGSTRASAIKSVLTSGLSGGDRMRDCHRVASLTPWRAALLLGASLPLLACGAGTGDTPSTPDAAGSASTPAAGSAEHVPARARGPQPALGGTVLAQHDEPLEIEGADNGAGNWGYTHNGRPHVRAHRDSPPASSIVEVTDPTRPRNVALVPGPASHWREVRTYGDYVYVTTEAPHGLDIIGMANPDAARARSAPGTRPSPPPTASGSTASAACSS